MATNDKYLIPRNETRETVLLEWADNVLDRWIKEMETQGLTNEQIANRALRVKVWNASGGDKTKIVFFYRDYLRYLDLGVGRGEKYTRKKMNPTFRSGEKYPETSGYHWQVKPWFLPILRQRIYSLQRILERKYGEYAQLMIIKNLSPEELGVPSEFLND